MTPSTKTVKVFKSGNKIGTVKAARNGVEGRDGFVLGRAQKKGSLLEYVKAFREERRKKEIKHYQTEVDLVFSTSCMQRLIEEILAKLKKSELWISDDTVEAIQEVCELFLTVEFYQARLAQAHTGRITLMVKDLVYIREARHAREGYYICYNKDTGAERIRVAAARKKEPEKVSAPDKSVDS